MKTVTLSSPIDTPRGRISELRFREPTQPDWVSLGAPVMIVRFGESYVIQEKEDVIGLYMERLVQDFDINFFCRLTLRDTLKIKEVIIGFFQDAVVPSGETTDGSPPSTTQTSPTNSSSGSDGTFVPSKI